MSDGKRKNGVWTGRGIRVVVLAAVIGLTGSTALGEGLPSWLEWLFAMISADDVPQRPALTEVDRESIAKARVMLARARPDATDSLLLGILAAAEGDEDEAARRFELAHRLEEGSALPLTMAAQTQLQEGKNRAAAELHERALTAIRARRGRASLQAANAHLDLAVAYEKLGDPDKARAHATDAMKLIRRTRMPPSQKALAYLQAGTVYRQVLRDPDAAAAAWEAGAQTVATRREVPEKRLKYELNLKLARNTAGTDAG
ncbi:MAG: tetratricopeptide repeat protein, partial [Planctomycetota bacterium]